MRLRNLTFLLLLFGFLANGQRLNGKEKALSKKLMKHIEYLASDDLEGRATGSPGELKSANYIAGHFQDIGLQPIINDSSYYQIFSVASMRMAQPNTSLKIGEKVYTLFQEMYPVSPSANNGFYDGTFINIGYGIEDPGLKHNDYKDKEVKGKAVLINLDLPGGSHPHSRFLSWSGVEYRVDYAKSKGARAVVFHTKNEDLIPSGKLKKTLKNSGIPVLFVKDDLANAQDPNGDLRIDILITSVDAHNVVGYIDNGAQTHVLIGAHHDHLGYGELGGSLAEKPGQIHNGADDNASGVAALIELARIIKFEPKHFQNNNYLFVAFTGEEQGLIGSKYFSNSNAFGIAEPNYIVNMDMVGHLDEEKKTLVINGVGTSPTWNEVIEKVPTSKKKIAKIKTTESGIGASDHSTFYMMGFPAVHFFTGQHEFYHKPTDDVQFINEKGVTYVTCYIRNMLCDMDKLGKIEFTPTKDENQGRMNFNVTLGIMPDYVFDGEGLRVDGVKEGKTGFKAGLKKGDVIVNMDGKPIGNIQDYMKQLSSLKKGTKTTVTVRRGEQTKVLDVQF